MLLSFWLCFASTVTATPPAESQNTKNSQELLRRDHSGSQKSTWTKDYDDEEPRRARTTASYSLTEEQMRAAHALGQAISQQPKHEQERMVKILQAVIHHSEARIQEHRRLYPNHKGPVSLLEANAFPARDGDASLDDVPHRDMKPIHSATPESLAQESAGWVPPPGLKEASDGPHGWQDVRQQMEQWSDAQQQTEHPPPSSLTEEDPHAPNGLSEYWKKANTSSVIPSYFTQGNPELPPDLSAFEKDNYEGEAALSEYFGPFRLDYGNHAIECNGWNFVISSPLQKPGLGNMMIGEDNFVTDATNSFIIGSHNTARGDSVAIIAGSDNEASGEGDVVIGGEENIAEGLYSNVDGGYRNEAAGFYDVVSGGAMNVATGNFAVVAGGQNNYASGAGSSITGGRGNEAVSILSSINGGAGNKASFKHSTVVGGVGLEDEKSEAAMWVPLDEHDREEVASKDFSKSHHGGAAWAQTLDVDYST